MNIVKLKSMGFIFACFFITPSYLFSQDIKFKPLPEFDQTELGYGGVTDMTQDADGYMWFSTLNGLYRYDGYQIVTYLNEKGNPNSLAFNHTNTVYADENGLIWIGIFGKGMDCLNPKTGNFKHYTFNPNSAKGISNDSVSIIRGDTKGGLWVGTHNGLNYFNTQTEEFIPYKHNENDPTSLSYDKIKTIYRDKAGTIWVGAGLPFLNEGGRINKGGLNRFNPQANNFTRYLHNPNEPNSLMDNHVTAIFEDSRGIFWVGTMKDGLHTMDRSKGTFERHPYDKAHLNNLSRPPVKNVIPYADDYISFILEDATKAIWIGTMSNGVNRYDPPSKKMTFYDGVKDTTRGLKYCCYFTAFISKDSVLWFAPWLDELVKADPYLKKIPFTSHENYLKGAIKENKDILWLYGEKGLIRKDLKTGIQKYYKHDPKKSNSLSHDYIKCIEIDKNRKKFISK